MVEPRIYCAMCVSREDLNKSAHWTESFIAVFCSEYYWTLDLFTLYSMNEKRVLNIVDFLSIYYVIVLSSVLFGYGTFICMNANDIIL